MPRLWINETQVDVTVFEAHRTLLEFLRHDMELTGTKEGCASGDCGACTVIVRRLRSDDAATGAEFLTLNSCITPLGAVLGAQVLTVDALAGDDLHPVQARMVEEHGSQCGYCTPGFVMSLVGHQLQAASPDALQRCSRSELVRAISGNLCRCTGYRPILDAARQAAQHTVAAFREAAAAVPVLRRKPEVSLPDAHAAESGYHRPASEAELCELLRGPGRDCTLVAGATDLWLRVTQDYEDLGTLIDVTGVHGLDQVTVTGGRLRIGAAVTHERLRRWFGAGGALPCRAIATLLERFASPQIRQRGTLGGNIANASPVADWPPVLMALDATLEMADADGNTERLPLTDFYLGYRQTRLGAGRYLRAIELDAAVDWQALHVYKVSKRVEDDIASVLGAFYLKRDGTRFPEVRIAYGGMAATPVRLADVEARLRGGAGTRDELDGAVAQLETALTPISDVRASSAYRLAMAGALLERAFDAARGAPASLEEALEA